MGKTIFLADDDDSFREQIRGALEKEGHNVAIEVKNYDEAITKLDEARKLGVEILVTDGKMPNEEDGPRLAGQLNHLIPELLVVSISYRWGGGRWEDPNFKGDKLHPTHGEFGIDINGRKKMRSIDLSYHKFETYEGFAAALNDLQFSLRDEQVLGQIERENTRRSQEIK